MALQGIHLTWVVVKDLDKAIAFYTNTLGFTLNTHVPQFGWAELTGKTGSRLGVAIEMDKGNEWDGAHVKAGSNGVITIVVDDIAESSEEYKNKGVKLLGQIMEIPGEVKLQTFQDPDGNLFQLVEVLRQ